MTTIDDVPALISLAVHEFRTPASVVSGSLRMVLRDTEHPVTDRQRKMREEAEKSAARLAAMLAELSEVGKLDSGAIALQQRPLELFSLISDVASGVHEAADRGVRLELRGENAGAPLIGDETRLRAAFDAIFRAILREQPTEAIVVGERRLIDEGGRRSAVLVVGPEPSVQAAYAAEPAPFDDKRGGLGLALPLARRVIEGHGGRLWAPAGADGRGAALVSLPVTESQR